jgi:hypothetical protein
MAGSSSNWYKVGTGKLKGQRVYIAKQAVLDLGISTRAVRQALQGSKTVHTSIKAKIAKIATQTPPGAAQKGGALTPKALASTTAGQNARIQAHGLALRLSEVQARLRTGKGKPGDAQYQNELEGSLQSLRSQGHIKTTDYRPETKPQFQTYARQRGVRVTFLTGKQADAIPTPKKHIANAPAKFAVRVRKGNRTQTFKANENQLREIIDDFAFGAWAGKGPRSATPLMKPLVSSGV